MSNTLPSAGTTTSSGSKTPYMLFTSPSNPLNTESRMTMAATGTPTAKMLTLDMMFITEREPREERYLRAKSDDMRPTALLL